MASLRLPKAAGKAAAKVPATTTSYSAKGAAIPPPHYDSEDGSSQPTRILETVPQLVSPSTRLRVYAAMMNDAGVNVSMRVAKTPVLGADFYVEPASDSQDDADIADFICDNLFGGMSSPFTNSLEDILHMYEDGFSVLEKVYEERQWSPDRTGANGKTYTMLKKLAVRPPSTVPSIDYDNNGGPATINHKAIQSDGTIKDVPLKPEQVLIFTYGRIGGDLTGKSLLRTAYPHWYYKTELYKIDAIQKERHSLGVPKGKLLPGYNPQDKSILRSLLRNIRSNEEGFVMETPNVEINFMDLPKNMVDPLQSINHHNIMILMNVMAQFLALGVEGGGGGRATAGQGQDIFMKSLKFIASYIADVINMYLIPELVVWNFPTSRFPRLMVRNIGETRDLQMLGSALSSMFAQGALTTDRETENWIRSVFDIPAKLATEPGVDPNAKQQAFVTLFDAAGNELAQIPAPQNGTQTIGSNGNGNGNSNGNGNGATPQKGNVKTTTQPGNKGKPTGAAFSETVSHIHMPSAPVHTSEHHIPVEVDNHYEFSAPPVEVSIHEGAIQAPAPIIHIHMPEQSEHPQPMQAKSANVKRNDDGTTTVEYIYDGS